MIELYLSKNNNEQSEAYGKYTREELNKDGKLGWTDKAAQEIAQAKAGTSPSPSEGGGSSGGSTGGSTGGNEGGGDNGGGDPTPGGGQD